jgi:hypothetical protein
VQEYDELRQGTTPIKIKDNHVPVIYFLMIDKMVDGPETWVIRDYL